MDFLITIFQLQTWQRKHLCNVISSRAYERRRVLTSYIISDGTPQPLTPSTRLCIRVPSTTPTTAPDSSSTMGPPLDPGVGSGSNNRCESESYVPGCMNELTWISAEHIHLTYPRFSPCKIAISKNGAPHPFAPHASDPRVPSGFRRFGVHNKVCSNGGTGVCGVRRDGKRTCRRGAGGRTRGYNEQVRPWK